MDGTAKEGVAEDTAAWWAHPWTWLQPSFVNGAAEEGADEECTAEEGAAKEGATEESAAEEGATEEVTAEKARPRSEEAAFKR